MLLFHKNNRNRFPCVSIELHGNTRESLGELEIAVVTLTCGLCFHSISRSPKLHLCCHNSMETRKTFFIWYVDNWQECKETIAIGKELRLDEPTVSVSKAVTC